MNTNYIFIPLIFLLLFSCSNETTELKTKSKPEKLYSVSVYNKFGFIDKQGNVVIEPKFDNIIGNFEASLHPVMVGKWDNHKWGYIDRKGEFVINPQFDFADAFSEGLASVRINRKYGFIDKTGRIVIKPEFDYVNDFSEGLAAVKIQNKWGYINRFGKLVLPSKYDYAPYFEEGLALVKLKEKTFYINRGGQYIREHKDEGHIQRKISDHLGIDQYDLLPYQQDSKFGFKNIHGDVVIKPNYDFTYYFANGFAPVQVNGL